MSAQIRILKADILADLAGIAEIYATLARQGEDLGSDRDLIVVAYYLHNLYCAFESIFQRIAEVFGEPVSDRPGWHVELLRHMTLDIEGLRPRLLSQGAYDSLDELRRFRHLFRSAYRLRLDAGRLMLVLQKAHSLSQVYRADMGRFLSFLDGLSLDEPKE